MKKSSMLKTAATVFAGPVILAGIALKKTGGGIVTVGNAAQDFGQRTEDKGRNMQKDYLQQMELASAHEAHLAAAHATEVYQATVQRLNAEHEIAKAKLEEATSGTVAAMVEAGHGPPVVVPGADDPVAQEEVQEQETGIPGVTSVPAT